MSDGGYPKFRNDRGVPEISIGVKKFMCIGESPPQDHPHVYINMGEADTILCPYCATRFRFDPRRSRLRRANPKRGIGFEEAQQLFSQPYWLDQRSDIPEQYLAIGWVGDRLYSVIFEFREDEQGEILHLVTLWKSTKEEIRLYEENS